MEVDCRHTYIRTQIEDSIWLTRQFKVIVVVLKYLPMYESIRALIGPQEET
jgi:hypothetical protein